MTKIISECKSDHNLIGTPAYCSDCEVDYAKTRITELLNDLLITAVEIEKTNLPKAREFSERLGLTSYLTVIALATLGINIDLDESENDWKPND